MRRFALPLASVLLFAAGSAGAADKPANLQPLPDVPPPPVAATGDAELEPQVTITTRGEDKVEEYRINGRLYMIKVTPPHGVPYYLVDEQGHGVLSRKDSVDSATRPPMWVIGTF